MMSEHMERAGGEYIATSSFETLLQRGDEWPSADASEVTNERSDS
jgi:hypothetical protein